MYTNDELINICKIDVENSLKSQLGNKRFRYLIREYSDFIEKYDNVKYVPEFFYWDESKQVSKEQSDFFSTNIFIHLKSKGELIFTTYSTEEKKRISHDFNLFISMYFQFDSKRQAYNFDVIDGSKKILQDYNENIWKILERENLIPLNDNKTLTGDKSSSQFFIENVEGKMSTLTAFGIHDDIVMCHQDIAYAISELIAYKPYITDLTLVSSWINGKQIFHYYPNYIDKRYLSNCGRILELLYNFWDKIGGLLAAVFTSNIPEKRRYFGIVIDNITEIFKDNGHYHWLKSFKDNEYKELNEHRKKVVHYASLERDYFKKFLESYDNAEKIIELQKEKESFIEYFKEQFNQTNNGFYHTLRLIVMK